MKISIQASEKAIRWYRGCDTGISSETIFEIMTGIPVQRHGYPHDPSDFGRCHRLLEKFPSWRKRLHEVAKRFPAWGPLVREWDGLTEMYLEALKRPDGMAPEMYARMKDLESEARR